MKKKKFVPEPVINDESMDLSKYDIEPRKAKDFLGTYKLYDGSLTDAIRLFEKRYGEIDGKIYYDESANRIGITGSKIVFPVDYQNL